MNRTARLHLNGVDEPNGSLDLDPLGFGSTFTHLTDSPPSKLTAKSSYSPSGTTAGAQESAEPESRPTRLHEDMATETANVTTSPSPPSTSLVNPATIPVRTSSNNAVVNGDKQTSPKKEPRKHRSMASVPEERKRYPEVDERNWLSQSKQPRNSHSYSQPPTIPGPSSPPKAPPTADMLRGVGADLISGMSRGWSPEKENILKGPFEYLESHPGKDIRTQLITAFNTWLQVPSSSLRTITGVVTMLHTASLLIDDVEDSSQLRRGVPVAHSIFGIAQTINSANYVYFCALQELLKLNNPEAIRIYTDELLSLHRGQGMDLFWRDTLTCPSEDDYLEMVGNKTGGLFRLAIKLMCAESPTYHSTPSSSSSTQQSSSSEQTDYIPLVNTIGLLFQILDDYKNLNLADTTYTANKGLCEDLTEGKFSFPIIHAIRSDPTNLVLINILKQKTQDEEVKKYAVSYMERTGSFTYTRRVLRGLTKKAMALIEEVDAGRGKTERIREILERLRIERHERKSVSA